MSDPSAVRLLGAPGLTRDVVAAHLAAHPAIVLAEQGTATAAVCVLAEPEPPHWEEARQAGAPVVLVAGMALDERETVAAVVDGADAVLDCMDAAAAVVDAVLTVATEGPSLNPRQAGALARALREREATPTVVPPALTAREAQILHAIDRGESLKQTADALGVARKTVENLQCRLFRKIGARNRAQAVVRAHALGLATGDPED